jgi:hypothetical protein
LAPGNLPGSGLRDLLRRWAEQVTHTSALVNAR